MNKLFLIILSALIFSQCSKKTTEAVSNSGMKNNEVFRKTAPAPAAARPINLGTYSSFTLANGLNVIVVENHKLPRVSYQISLNHDPIAEGEQAGASNFAGDLLTKGTKTRSKAKIDEEIDFIGASLNSSLSGLFASSLKKHSDKLLNVMTDVLYNPSFPKEEFEKMKSQSLSGLATTKTDANAIAGNLSQVLTYGASHPYGEIETEKTINSITLDNCKNYYNTFFRPNNAYLVIVGDITPDAAKMQAEKYFGSWKRGEVPSVKYDMPKKPTVPTVAFANKDGAVQSVINIVYPVDLKIGSNDELAANVMNNILGGGIFSGRLMQNLREKKAYTYGARSNLNSDKLVGSFKAFASVRNEVTDSSITEFLYELKRMSTEPVEEKDIQLAKNSMAGGFARSLESPQTIANFALNTFRYNLPKDYYNTYLSRLEKVSIADVQKAASKFITPQNATIIVVGNKDKVAESLLKFDGDGKIDYYDAYGQLLKMDNLAIPDGLKGSDVIEDYLDAIGGVDKLKSIKSKVTNATMAIMGQEATVVTKQKYPMKYYSSMTMNGMVMNEQKCDGNKASMSGMGQPAKVVASNEEGYNDVADNAPIFEHLDYASKGYITELKGKEDINGESCYKVAVTDDKGKTQMQYFSVKTSLLLKTDINQGEGEEMQTISTEFKDYKEVDGILMPYEVVINGAAPFPLAMKIGSYVLNGAINDADFEVK